MSSVPPGWDENPTRYGRRVLLAVLAFGGLLVAGYLSLFQLGVFDSAWDPFFDPRPVLELTEPLPDAVAGVLAYGAELVLLAIGGPERWRTAPWTCLALGIGEARAAYQQLRRATAAGSTLVAALRRG